MPSTNVSMFTALAGGIYMNNNNSENHCRILHKKNQYEVLGNIEKDTTTGWMTALIRVKDPDGKFFLPQSVTRSRLIQRGIGVLNFLYDYDAGLQDDDLKIIKNNIQDGIPENEICVLAPVWDLLYPFSKELQNRLPEVRFDAPDITPIKRDQMNVFYKLTMC